MTNASAQNEAMTSPAPPQFVGDRPRSEVVNLAWPLEYDGMVYRAVQVSRLSVGQIERFFATFADLNATDPEAAKRLRFPMFSVPDAVMDALDDDDAVRVQEVAQDFLPRRFREATGASAPDNGEPSPSL